MDALDPSLFIGSSTEGLRFAKALQAELDHVCEATLWTQGVFTGAKGTLESLVNFSSSTDFAVLVLTSDDVTVTRQRQRNVARDNVIFELGLFLGALGPERVFIVTPRGLDLDLPSDLLGVNRLDFRDNRADGRLQAALGSPATHIEAQVRELGLRESRSAPVSTTSAGRRGLSMSEEQSALEKEIAAVVKAAKAQGWTIRTLSDTAFRLVSPNGRRYSLALGAPATTRDALRPFAGQLRDAGLRISTAVLSAPS